MRLRSLVLLTTSAALNAAIFAAYGTPYSLGLAVASALLVLQPERRF